jgi:hypothetical protein
MEDIDLQILHHIGRNTITLRKVLQVLFFEGRTPQTAIDRLENLGYITTVRRVLPGNFSYYQLKKKGAAVINVSENKAKPKEPKGLAQDIAALWFSCMGDRHRKRLTDTELQTLFGAPKGSNIIYVAEGGEDPTVFRMFIPEADTKLDRYVTTLKKAAHDICSDEKLIRWVERGTLQIAVLLTNDGRVQQLADLIRANEFPDLRIKLAIAPTHPRELAFFIPPDKEPNT